MIPLLKFSGYFAISSQPLQGQAVFMTGASSFLSNGIAQQGAYSQKEILTGAGSSGPAIDSLLRHGSSVRSILGLFKCLPCFPTQPDQEHKCSDIFDPPPTQ